MKKLLPAIFLLFIVFLASLFILNTKPQNVSAAVATHVVISEIQIGNTGESDDEFLELYNPTDSAVDLTNWRIGRKSASGNDQTDLVASVSGTIPARGYFLLATTEYTGTTSADQTYSATNSAIANNNTLLLFNSSGGLVDMVGMGTATASETAAIIPNPPANDSVERKANSTSNSTSMGPGGADELMGNGEDMDNNSLDFVAREIPQPQNSLSSVEPPPSPSPSPTLEPSLTPTIEPSPTSSPSPTTAPSPTLEPSPSPTLSPAPSLSPTPILSPTPSVPAPRIIARGPIFTCTLNYKPWKLFNKTYFFPTISCARTVSN